MSPPTAVLLLQMGGPSSLEEVEPYLRRLFADPDLVQWPGPLALLRRPLARCVALLRAPRVREQYRAIGGGSPNNEITRQQAAVLEARLRRHGDYRCFAALNHAAPSVEEALARAQACGCRRFVGLSLFPHYSRASAGASFAALGRAAARLGVAPGALVAVERWGSDPIYLDALAARTRAALAASAGAHPLPPALLVSAHGIPVSCVRRGDPYVAEVEATVAGLQARLPRGTAVHLAFQSRATPVRWVGPAALATVRRLGAEGARNIVVLAVSFVSDHVETLYEVDVLLACAARAAGVERFARVPAFNDGGDLAAVLEQLVLRAAP